MHWSTAIYKATERFDGGARSFPPARDDEITRKYGYDPPNEAYQRLLSRAATASSSQHDEGASPHSAGWLVPDPDDIDCKPVVVGNSILALLGLLHEMLPDALSNDNWARLVHAAQLFADEGAQEPPSAQGAPASALPASGKRPSSSSQVSSSSKRARIEEAIETPADSPKPSAQRAVLTVTNNNRRAERQRVKAHKAALVERSLDLGLVAPDHRAVDDERGAYASIPLKDKEIISWLFKQEAVDPKQNKVDFYTAADQPYAKARDFLTKARALGNPSSQEHAAQFLHIWRQRGTLFSGRNAAVGYKPRALHPTRPSSNPDQAFCSAWERCSVYEEVMKSVHIEYRWAQALLGKALTDKLSQIERDDGVTSFGRANRTRAINSLLELVHSSAEPSKKERNVFRSRLAKAFKWYKIAEGLGWGVLLVMPEDVLSKTWIEHTIRAWGVDVFINLVKRERPDVCLAARQFDDWLGPDGIVGGEIKGKTALSIEVKASDIAYEVEEIRDSEDETGDEDVEDVDGRVEITHSQFRAQSAPATVLRQTTLPELFKAVT